ncbi:replication initiator protein [Dipodfec virus UA23Rod_1114]|uniref:Replication initiator protein n=1 Tax=Dipodfec virus UA23Rod_1114 TaxID=2936533 RepID=A0A976N1Y1_9VIRU|nr:replication initiator protein [Dipodfec virus UA23Rod_1114]
MCLSPQWVSNPYWRSTLAGDRRSYYDISGNLRPDLLELHPLQILVPCGQCVDCLKKKARDWRFRLGAETLYGCKHGAIFVTLTFSDRFLPQISSGVAPLIRRFYDRFRKRYGVTPRYWFITETGKDDRYTHRLHLHGVLFDPPFYLPNSVHKSFTKMNKSLRKVWSYGNTFVGYFSFKTCNYCLKYLLKSLKFPDDHPEIFCSNNIGISFFNDESAVRILSEWRATCYAESRLVLPPLFQLGDFLYSIPRYLLNRLIDDPAARLLFSYNARENPSADPPTIRGRRYVTPGAYFAALDNLKRLLEEAGLPFGPKRPNWVLSLGPDSSFDFTELENYLCQQSQIL